MVSKQGVNAFSIQDVYAKFFAKEYNANIIPYLKSWGVENSSEVEREIVSSGAKAYMITSDSLTSESLDEVMAGENLTLKYGLVSEEVLIKYNIKSNVSLTINIDDFNVIKNKDLLLMQNGKLIKKIKIDTKNISIDGLNIGTYEIRLPISYDYENKLCVVNLVEGDNEVTYDYIKIDKTEKLPLTAIKIKGIYGTFGYTLTFSDDYKVGKVTFGGADLGNRNATWESKPDEVYISVMIKNAKGEEVDKIEVKGNHYFTDYTLTNPTINFETNWTITIYTQRPNLVGVYYLETNSQINAYNFTNNTITYQVTEKGLKLVGDDNFDEEQVLYEESKKQTIKTIEDYKDSVTDEEIANKRINSEKKSQIINAYDSLKESDREPYTEFITKLKAGGSPTITIKDDKLILTKGEKVDLYSLIEIFDNEDNIIESNSQNVEIVTEFSENKVGLYTVKYIVTDSDGNQSTCELEITVVADYTTLIIACVVIGLILIFCILIIVKKKKQKAKKHIVMSKLSQNK